jgi:AraC-like DNA-binding protein
VIKDYKNIDDYLRTSKLGVEKPLDDFLIYNYQDVNQDALLTQNAYRHHFYELTLDINECCSYQVDSFNLPLQGNRLTIIAPNRLQSSIAHMDLPQESKGFSIFFERNFLGIHFNEDMFKGDFHYLRPDCSPSFELTEKQLNELTNIFSIINYEQKEYGKKSKETIRNLTNVVFEKTKVLNKQTPISIEISPLVSKFLELCNSSFLKLHTVKEYALILSVTPKHLTEIVKEQTGLTALETLHNLKVGYAKGLLKQTNFSVKQIAFELGFDNPEYFNVFFKKLTGFTPIKFRQI